jgi:hypothetical protein
MHLHSAIAAAIRKRLQTATANGKISVGKGDPRVSDYLREKGHHDKVYFADVSIHDLINDNHCIQDVTSTQSWNATTRQQLEKELDGGFAAYEPGDAAAEGTKRKHKFYDNIFYRDERITAGTVELDTISLETNGSMDKKTKEVIRLLAHYVADGKKKQGQGPPLKAEVDLEQRQITQHISVALQVWRARSVSNSIKYNTLDHPPTIPYVPGSRARIPELPPPAFRGLPANQRRTHAVAPMPPSRPPGIRGTRHDYWE